MFGGRSQHVCQISLKSERVGLELSFFGWFDMEWPAGVLKVCPFYPELIEGRFLRGYSTL